MTNAWRKLFAELGNTIDWSRLAAIATVDRTFLRMLSTIGDFSERSASR